MNFEGSGVNILIVVLIIVDLALICAILLIYKRLKFLDPQKLDHLIALLRENEALVKGMITGTPGARVSPKVSGAMPREKSSKEDDITALFRTGKSAQEIASLLNLTQAEVELTIERYRAGPSG